MDNRLDVFERLCRRRPEAEALIFVAEEKVIGAAEARRGIEALIGILREQGVPEGARVAVVMNRTPASVLWAYAVLAGNMSLIPLSPQVREEELRRKLAHSTAAVLIAPGAPGAAHLPEGCVGIDPDDPITTRALEEGAEPRTRRISPDSEAMILYTSGTLGDPKGVILSHRAVISSFENTLARLPYFSQGQRFLSILPLHGAHGLLMTLLAPAYGGAAVLIDRTFDAFGPPRFFETLGRYKPTCCSLVPAILAALRDFHPRAGHPSPGSLRGFLCASAILPDSLRRWSRETFGLGVHNNYGMSETASWVSIGEQNPRDEPGSVGHPHIELVIIDEEGRRLGPGDVGEIRLRGDQVMGGYLNLPERSAAAFSDGYFRTGDLGRLTEDGRLVIVGRIKDQINVGGEKVQASEVEQAALALEGVAEAAAFPWPDQRRGEEVALAITLRPGARLEEASIKAALKKILSRVEFPKKVFRLEALPKNPGGKILRSKLFEICRDREEKT